MGGATWSGAASNQLVIADRSLRALGGAGTVEAQRSVSCSGSNGVIAAGVKIRTGGGSGDIYWSIYLDDAASNNLARWYGSTAIARGRVGGSITADMPLSSSGAWDDLYVEINTTSNKSEFFFNGVSYGTINGLGAGPAVATVRIQHVDRPTSSADVVAFDQLFIGSIDLSPPPLAFTRAGNQLSLAWPAAHRAATLETTTNLLPPTTWSAIPNPAVSNGQFVYSTTMNGGNRFFRLRR